jgi:hypothetical protein
VRTISPPELARATLGLIERLLPDLIAEHRFGHSADSRQREFSRAPQARHISPDGVVLTVKGRTATMAIAFAGCEL